MAGQIRVTRAQVIDLSHLDDVTLELSKCSNIQIIIRDCTGVDLHIKDCEEDTIETNLN